MSEVAQWTAELESPDLAAQARAAEALAQHADEVQQALVALTRRCSSSDESVANWCTSAIEDGGAPTTEQIPELTALLKDKHEGVVYWAVTLLGRAGRFSADGAGDIASCLSHTSAEVRQRAAWALGQIGAKDEPVLAALRKAAHDKGAIAKHAQRALERLTEA